MSLTRGPSACSRSRPASRCRCSAGTWPAYTPPSGTPPLMTGPLIRTRCDWVLRRAGEVPTPASQSSAAPAGWRSCSRPRDEKVRRKKFPLEGRNFTQCDQCCSWRLSKYLRKLGLKSKSWKCDRTWRSILRWWETRRRMMKGNTITQNIEGRLELSDEKTEFTQRLSTA